MNELSMHIMDIVQNSIKAGATFVELILNVDAENNKISFLVKDNGTGMSDEVLKKVKDPFYTTNTTRKGGLGIPLLDRTCNQCGGRLEIKSTEGKGTSVYAELELNNIDTPPLGDVGGLIFSLAAANSNVNFKFVHMKNGQIFTLETTEIKKILDGIPIYEPSVLKWLYEFIKEGLQNLLI